MTESNSWGGPLTWRQLQLLNAAGGPGRTEGQLLASGALAESATWGGPITLAQELRVGSLTEGDSWGGPLTWRQLNDLGGPDGGKITLRQLQAAGVPVEGDAWGGMVTLRQLNAIGATVLGDPLYAKAQQLPAFDLRFENGSIVDAIGGITPTFTRPSSVKNVWTGSGFSSVEADTPAFQVDPVTGRLGYLHEPAATNSIRNSSMVGAVAGTPGTLPNNWSESLSGLSRQVVGVGTELGLPFIDLRFSGTSTGTQIQLRFEGSNNIATTTGTVNTQTVLWRLTAGSLPLNFPFFAQNVFNAAVSYLGETSAVSDNTVNIGAFRRLARASQPAQAAAAWVRPYMVIDMANGQAVDFTIRLLCPQVESGNVATSPIVTAGSAVTRAADTMTVTGVSGTVGTLYVEAFRTGNGARPLMSFNDNTANERIELITSGTDPILNVVDGGVSQASVDGGTFAANSIIKLAAAVDANNFAVSINGGAPVVDSSGTMPTIDRLFIGTDQAGNRSIGPIYRIAYFPPGAAQSRIQAMTT